MTSGFDILAAEQGATEVVETTGSLQFHPNANACTNPLTNTAFSKVNGTTTSSTNISSGPYNISSATSSTYKYKIVKYNDAVGIESEPSTANSVSLSGASTFDVSCTSLFTEYIGSTNCSNNATSRCLTQEFNINFDTKKTSTTATLAAAPSAPFNVFRIYRTLAGGSDSYFLNSEKDTGAITDGTSDSDLGAALDTTIDTIDPPSFRYIENYKGTIFLAEDRSLRFSRIPVELDTDVDKYWLETDEIQIGGERSNATGLHNTSNSLLIFTNNSIQELTGFGVDSFRLQTLVQGIGTISDEAIETDNNGDIIFFAGLQGVYKIAVGVQATTNVAGEAVGRPSSQLTRLSTPDMDDIFAGIDDEINLDPADYDDADAYYDLERDLYFLFIGEDGFIFDNANLTWSHINGIQSEESLYVKQADTTGQGYILDDQGFFYKNFRTFTTGVTSGTVTGTPTSSTNTTLVDSGATFLTTNSGLLGQWVIVDNSTSLQYRRISANTATDLTISEAWDTNPTTSDTYFIAYIIPDIRSKQYNFAKPPRESQVQYFVLVHNKADSTQSLQLLSFIDKKSTAQESTPITIDLAGDGQGNFEDFIEKENLDMRSPWIQINLRTFIYNISNTINPPLDIVNYTFEVFARENK